MKQNQCPVSIGQLASISCFENRMKQLLQNMVPQIFIKYALTKIVIKCVDGDRICGKAHIYQ